MRDYNIKRDIISIVDPRPDEKEEPPSDLRPPIACTLLAVRVASLHEERNIPPGKEGPFKPDEVAPGPVSFLDTNYVCSVIVSHEVEELVMGKPFIIAEESSPIP